MERGNYDERRLYLAVQGSGRSGTPVLVEALARTSAERSKSKPTRYRVTRLLALGYDEDTSRVRKGDYRGVEFHGTDPGHDARRNVTINKSDTSRSRSI